MRLLIIKFIILTALIATGFYIIAEKQKTCLGVSYESLFRVLGRPTKTLDRAFSKISDIDIDDEKHLGRLMAEEMNSQKRRFYKSPRLTALVEKIAANYNPNNFQWEIYIEKADIVNAYALPGGIIVFYEGAIKVFDKEPELITIIAHEMGHVNLGHCKDSFRELVRKNRHRSKLSSNDFSLNLVLHRLASISFRKQEEYEADEYAFKTLVKLGYNPNIAISAYEKLGSGKDDPKNIFIDYFKSHPDIRLRTEYFKEKAKRYNKH